MKHRLSPLLTMLAGVAIGHATDRPPEPSATVEIRPVVVQGFTHPGIGLTREILENARTQVLTQREPWYSGYTKLAAHRFSAQNVICRNQSTTNPSKPDSDAFDSRGIEARLKQDADRAYRQALMYWFTAKEVHRGNAMNIIRIWSQMDPKKFKNYREDHIHASYPVQNLIRAAELMRYTSSPNAALEWTDRDTEAFINNFVTPAVTTFFDDNRWFMNQGGYPMTAAMAGDIFTNDRENYEKRVEWFTVNKSAPNQGWAFSIQRLARLVDTNALTGEQVDPIVQLVEMGRDQAHAAGDMDIFMNIARMMNAQQTKVDPVHGTPSQQPDAVGPYEFQDDRILSAADHFCRFMLGYDTPWIPVPYNIAPDGEVRAIYPRIADNYRGRIRGFDFWDAYFYYTYEKGINVAEKAPYYHEAFTKRIVQSDFDWIYIPQDVRGEGANVPATEQQPDVVEIEQRSTQFDDNAFVVEEADTSFVRVNATEDGTRIAILSCDTDRTTIGMRIRTNGVTEIEMSGFKRPWLLPDTRGEWRQVAYTMDKLERFIDIVYFTVKGPAGRQVDLDTLIRRPDETQAIPEFSLGSADLHVIAYVGAPVQLDFSTKGEGVRVGSLDLPDDAVLNIETGAFRWSPQPEGDFEFVVMAVNTNTITPKKVRLTVTADRSSAVEMITAAHDPEAAYVTASVQRCRQLYDQLVESGSRMDDLTFFAKLMELQAAFDQLEPLTPRLPDGSMDFPKVVVTSNIGEQIAHLTDGNDDTFPVHTLARNMYYVFDFGEGFQFSTTAFALEGRLNFENRTLDTAFFGSNDRKTWIRLTQELTTLPTALTRVEVEEALHQSKFRYLKIHKTSRQSAGLFEPAELRIYGQRNEVR